jgi:sulfur carrier protein
MLIQRNTVKIRYRDEEWELEEELSVREAIEEVGLSPDRLIAVRDGEIVNEDAVIQEGDEIKLLALIAGG